MSIEDYLSLDQSARNAKYEYLDGIARLMSGGSVAHDKIARNVAHFIEEQFLSGPCTVFGSDVQVLVGGRGRVHGQVGHAEAGQRPLGHA